MSDETGFKVTDTTAGWKSTDFEDIFVRKDCFLEGGLWLWGYDAAGSLGTEVQVNRSSPVQTISGGTNWRSISAGLFHSAGIKTDGTLWTWGLGVFGRLGDNCAVDRSSPVQIVSGGTNWRSVSLGTEHSAAIKADGSLWLWGRNNTGVTGDGRLGNNTSDNQSSPVQTVSGGTNWRSVSLGTLHSAAIKTDGTLWSWGAGSFGRLGNNCTASQSSPVQTSSGGTNWSSVSLGSSHSGAIKTDGTLWMWGVGSEGRLGNNNSVNCSSPVQTISGGTNWYKISLACNNSAAIKTDGSLWLWGSNQNGKLGNNNTSNQLSPVQTISVGANWRSVSLGKTHSAATKTDGTLWLWGANYCGAIGDNSTTAKSSPVQTIIGGNDWRSIAMYTQSMSIREDCW